jgi:hypothetical protein
MHEEPPVQVQQLDYLCSQALQKIWAGLFCGQNINMDSQDRNNLAGGQKRLPEGACFDSFILVSIRSGSIYRIWLKWHSLEKDRHEHLCREPLIQDNARGIAEGV